MFKAFNFKEIKEFQENTSDFLRKNYRVIGEDLYKRQARTISDSIDKYYIDNQKKILDGTHIMEEWFPQVKSHIFISHSHTDIDAIYELVGYLYAEYNIKAFVDAAVWGYADKLLQKIDDDHCYQNSTGTYNYPKRNITTSNVYLMLLNSLHSMIDNTECVFFIDTPNSVKSIPDQFDGATYSPWIFSELNIVEKIRIKKPFRPYELKFERRDTAFEPVQESVQVIYDIEKQLSNLEPLSFNDLSRWEKIKETSPHMTAERNLDRLYDIKGWLEHGQRREARSFT